MLIANPIYDSVFKYLLDDNRVAKVFISAIIGEEIEELTLSPTELKVKIGQEYKGSEQFLTVYRIDFAAKIKTEDGGHKLVLIEIQKAKQPGDIMRFRRYLGENYSNKNNYYTELGEKKPYPILSIYFLGKKLEGIKERVIHVKRDYIDGLSKKKISNKSEFIESLTHDSFIIQLESDEKVKHPRQGDLETLLYIFDQDSERDNAHILNIKEENVPEKYRIIIRRLHQAMETKSVVEGMQVEDEIIEGLKNSERKALHETELRKRAEQEKDIAIEEKTKAEQEKAKAEQEKAKAEQEKTKAEQEKAKAEQEKQNIAINSAKLMKQSGLGMQQIAEATGLSIEDIEKL